MKRKKIIYAMIIILSIGYLLYNFLLTDARYGMMMYHHYGYYDNFTRTQFYLNSVFNVFVYFVILIFIFKLVLNSKKTEDKHLLVLNRRLIDGEISREEYIDLSREIKKK